MLAATVNGGDLGDEHLSDSPRLDKGKGRAHQDEVPPSPSTEPLEEEVDPEQEEREEKLVQENLRRLAQLEANRRKSRRANSTSITVTPPLQDLTRRGSQLLQRARSRRSGDTSRHSSIDSSSSSFDSYRSPPHRSRGQQASLGSLAEVQEAALSVDTSVGGATEYVETPTSIDLNAARASRIGSRFVEDITSSTPSSPPDLSRPRPQSHQSTYSLHSIASTVTPQQPMGIYAQPGAQESTAQLVDRGEEEESFGAGFQRPKQRSVPWYEAVFCCACIGGDDEDEVQAGATMPSYV